MSRYIQHPVTGKLIPRDEYHRDSSKTAAIQGDIEPFVSPIDGSVISSRSHLRKHNERHGVTDARDYSPAYYAKKKTEREQALAGTTQQAREGRIDSIQRAMHELSQ